MNAAVTALPAAAIGCFPISKLAPMAMLRDYPPRSGMETEEAIANSRALPGLLGSVARFRTTLFHLRPSTHWSCDSPLGFPLFSCSQAAAARDQAAPFLLVSAALLLASIFRTSSANFCNVARSQAL